MLTADTKRKLQQAQYYQEHKEQARINGARWKANNAEKIRLKNRKLQVKNVYGLSWEEYELLYNKFSGHCGICGTSLKMVTEKHEQNKAACVDHDHPTGKVRGILCRSCNVALGHFKDSKDRIWNAYKYLEDHGC
jgi:hypothetical protein